MVRRKEWMTQFLKPHSKTEDDDQKGCDIGITFLVRARNSVCLTVAYYYYRQHCAQRKPPVFNLL